MPRTTACPSCGAALRGDAPWCTLCYTDLRPKPATVVPPPPAVPAPSAVYGMPAGDPLTQPLLDLALPLTPPPAPVTAAVPTWPCSMCEASNPLSESHCITCGKPFLAAVQESPTLVLPGVGDLSRFSRGQRACLALAAVAAVLVPLALITLLLTGRPSDSGTTVPSDQSTIQTTP